MAFATPQILRLGTVDYTRAWELQREIHEDVVAGRRQDTLILLEHEPVYTAGRRTQPEDRPVDGSPVIDVDRGGRITWHGPGQLVGYPILRLPDPVDVVGHVRRMESLLISVCEQYGVEGRRVRGRSGVWVGDTAARKIAAVGVRVARGVTMHGFALNVSCDLGAFSRIVPCGIRDAGVTSLQVETGGPVPIDAVAATVVALSGVLTGSGVG
jgi:lipoyl(octanoyl) transferase